jgi:predicted transcriptional regulator
MILEEVRDILNAEVLWGNDYLSMEIKMACGSDLMSDVLAFVKPGSLLFTGITNPQVVRTAEMAGIITICFVRGKKPQKETIKLAEEKKIPILRTEFTMYKVCGLLYKEGLPSCD